MSLAKACFYFLNLSGLRRLTEWHRCPCEPECLILAAGREGERTHADGCLWISPAKNERHVNEAGLSDSGQMPKPGLDGPCGPGGRMPRIRALPRSSPPRAPSRPLGPPAKLFLHFSSKLPHKIPRQAIVKPGNCRKAFGSCPWLCGNDYR